MALGRPSSPTVRLPQYAQQAQRASRQVSVLPDDEVLPLRTPFRAET